MTAARRRAVVLAAFACGAGIVALVLASERDEPKALWATFSPIVLLSFTVTGLYAMRRRPESRVGALLIALGFAWCLAALTFADDPAVFTFGVVAERPLGRRVPAAAMSFPSGRLTLRADRTIVLAGYAAVHGRRRPEPALRLARTRSSATAARSTSCRSATTRISPPHRSRCRRVLYAALFLVVLVRLTLRWRRAPAARAPAADARLRLRAAHVPARHRQHGRRRLRDRRGRLRRHRLLPAAFLAGLLRSHVAHLDAELRERLEELRASRARLVAAGDAERRRLERDLHDGAQSRLVGLAVLLGTSRRRLDADPEAVRCSSARRRS